MPSLPLLRLPQLVLYEIFRSLSIEEKIKLSFCSKRVSNHINNARLYSQEIIVDLDILSQKIKVHSENDEDIFEIFPYPDSGISQSLDIQHFYIAGCTVPVISISKGVQIFWKNHREGFLSVIRHLLMIFRCKFSTTIYRRNSDMYQPVFSRFMATEYFYPRDFLLSHLGNKDLDEILRSWKAGNLPNLKRLLFDDMRITDDEATILDMNFRDLDGKVIQTDDGSKKATLRIERQRIVMTVTLFE